MKSKLSIGFSLGLGIVCLGLSQGLWAQSSSTGCGYFPGQRPMTSIRPVSLILASDNDGVGITGLWKVKFVAHNSPGLPDGTVIDDGYATWHRDGTEIMNSGRPPITGNFCMGVWKLTRRSTYKLNHFALSWDPTGTNLIGPANIREEVVLGRSGNSYAGTFTIDQFDVDGNVLAHVAGQVTATRITAD
jgi:hypothetical protein